MLSVEERDETWDYGTGTSGCRWHTRQRTPGDGSEAADTAHIAIFTESPIKAMLSIRREVAARDRLLPPRTAQPRTRTK